MLSLQVLVSTMNEQHPLELYKRMNLSSDALIINQSDSCNFCSQLVKEYQCDCYTLNERGLSRSRNNALLRAKADIICVADDDMVYSDSYKSDIINEFERHPEADVIIFNVSTFGGERESVNITKFEKLKRIEYKEFGSVHISIRREKLMYSNTWFNVMFGSGSKINSGEDTIFLHDLLNKGFKIYKSPIEIAKVDMRESSWFNGYNETYFKNKGMLVAYIYNFLWLPAIIALSIKNSKSKMGSYSKVFQLFKWYYSGVREYKSMK